MRMIRIKLPRLVLALWLVFAVIFGSLAEAGERPLDVYLFWAEGCPHCANEMIFIKQWIAKDPQIRVHTYEVTREPASRELYSSLVRFFGIQSPAVPFIVIGGRYIQGYVNAGTTGEAIKAEVSRCLRTPCGDVVHWLQTGTDCNYLASRYF
jgi:hypothetical protein